MPVEDDVIAGVHEWLALNEDEVRLRLQYPSKHTKTLQKPLCGRLTHTRALQHQAWLMLLNASCVILTPLNPCVVGLRFLKD